MLLSYKRQWLYTCIYQQKRNNKAAVIKVEDNGIGMEKDVADNAFDLFYQGEYENLKDRARVLPCQKS